MGITLEQFVQHLTASGLMSATEVNVFQDTLPPPKPKDAETFARELVQSSKLTRYQAQVIYQGKTKGLVFGDYRTLDKLGQGGMGIVLKAEHRRMKRLVAVKMISGPAMKSPDAVKRFYREVEAAAKLNHPNIVQAYDAGQQEGVHYLVMEYVEGKDLAAIVKEKGPLPVAQAVECIVQAARGLQYAHKQGIVHRDIKPANLLVDKEGTVKILDMGLARIAGLVDQDDKDRLTGSGQVMGTCDYMAPEQALDTHHADRRADIYSLGCTLYRLLTNETLYKGESLVQILLGHQQSPIPSLRKARPDVSPQLDAIYQKMVAKKPEDRQQTMAEVIADLERCMGKRSGAAQSLAEQSAASDQAMQDALSFLQEGDFGTATLAKKKPAPSQSRTIAYQPGQGEKRHPERSEGSALPRAKPRFFAALRMTRTVAVALGLVGVVVVLLAITLRIRHPDGHQTVVQVPDGSEIDVSVKSATGSRKSEKKGVAARKSDTPPPLAKPTMLGIEAANIQKQWAEHLGVPVEETNSIGMPLVFIPPGEFEMGSTPEEVEWALEQGREKTPTDKYYFERVPSESPRHKVKITKPFYLGMYPVTQGEYQKVMGINPSAFTEKQVDVATFKPPLSETEVKYREQDVKKVLGKDTSRHPVETVNWEEAMEFCRKLSAMPAERAARRGYRLPTEAEWEYACRAGTATRWYCGDDEAGVVEVAWFGKNAGGMTHPVGEKKPDAWGLYDMSGNVWQWCADWYSKDYYAQSPPSDPAGPPAGSSRVVRGGCWTYNPFACRAASRSTRTPANRAHSSGLRVVCEVTQNEPLRPAASAPRVSAADVSGGPPPAIAPFDAPKAREYQKTWAKHLNLPVEQTNSIGTKLVFIPPGEFEMGSTPEEVQWALEQGKQKNPTDIGYFERVPSEAPRHRVKITKPFYLAMYQVTQAEYQKVMGINPSAFTEKQVDVTTFKPPLSDTEAKARAGDVKKVLGKDTSRHPVETVKWDEAMEFCSRLSAMPAERAARRVYRLPTEAEWEYACRAGTATRWYCGDDEARLVEMAWFTNNAGGMTHPVGEKNPNAWGLYDMYGNVWQWCGDWYAKDYFAQPPPNDLAGPPLATPVLCEAASGTATRSTAARLVAATSRPLTAPATTGFGWWWVVEVGSGGPVRPRFIGRPG